MPRTPYADWQDDLAWMDGMRGARWNAALKKEQRLFNSVTNIPAIKQRAGQFLKVVKELHEQREAMQKQLASLPAHIPKAIRDAQNDFDVAADGTIVYLFAKDYGSQFLTLRAVTADGQRRLWEKTAYIGSTIAILNDRCYYTLAATNNRDYAVESCDVATGGNIIRHFEEPDERKLVHLCKAERGALFFSVEDSDIYDLYDLPAKGKPRHIYGGAWFTVLGYANCNGNGNGNTTKPVFISLKNGEQQLHNLDWPLPSIDNGYVTCGSIANGWLITNLSGVERLYKWGPSGTTLVLKIYGTFEVDSQRLWQGDRRALLFALRADDVPLKIIIDANGSITQAPITLELHQPFDVVTRQTTSADGSRVNFLIVRKHSSSRSRSKPAGLLVYGYGSYGIPTYVNKAYSDFTPLIEAGWSVAFAFIRGGGDRDDAWAAAGRLYNRQRSIEDFEAVICAARGATGVPPERTVITGRSAGGMLVGAVGNPPHNGSLFGGIYAEVPFLDVLKTMGNKSYPRTTTEQNEFGDPARSLTDFMVALEHSPVNRVAGTGAPNIFVLARTAENDSQVFAYEPLKWIWRLREGSEGRPKEGKLFAFATGQGHFYVADAAEKARSIDLAILHEWATNTEARKKIASYNIQMANNGMPTTRKNRTERKQRKQEGGKRKHRKATGTRKAHRKGTRKSTRQRKH